MTPRPPFWAWPGGALVRYFAGLYVSVLLLFLVVFVGADLLTARRAHRVRVDFPFEAAIPLVPAMAWVYMSVYLPLLAAPFVLRSRRELRALAVAASSIILCAGVGFLLVPAVLGYPPLPELGDSATAAVLRFADRLNLDYDLVPSLHVALGGASLGIYAGRAPWPGRLLLGAWALGIGAATLLTHQHHVVDVVTGFALAAAAVVLVYRPMAAARSTPASS